MLPLILILAAAGVIGTILFITSKRKKQEEVNIEVNPDNSNRKPIKKALLVGINKYRPDLNADLRGCVNDVEGIRTLLVNKYAFKPENIRVVINERATKAGILSRLQWLINNTKDGDILVFHYSGHGSQIRDRNGDELNDHLDELLCPHDLNWDDPLTDDILNDIFSKLPKGVQLIMIADCCHSGTITRDLNPINCNCKETKYMVPRRIIPPFDIRSRSLGQSIPKVKFGSTVSKVLDNVILLSGCKDNQTSADAYINGKYNGALSWAIYETLTRNKDVTYEQLHKSVCALLKKGGFSQEPQLNCPQHLKTKKVFN